LLSAEALDHLEQDGQVSDKGTVSPWVRVSEIHAKALAALVGNLRLCPSSRTRAEDHSLQKRPVRSAWEISLADDELLAR
jgi:hypothetical protein